MLRIRRGSQGWRGITSCPTTPTRWRGRLIIEAVSRTKCAHEFGESIVNSRHLGLQIPNPPGGKANVVRHNRREVRRGQFRRNSVRPKFFPDSPRRREKA